MSPDIFSRSGNQLAKNDIQPHENQGEKHVVQQGSLQEPEHTRDIKTMSKTALRKKYSAEAHSHKNMKQRCKDGKGFLTPEFVDFSDFLGHVGPKLHPHFTLDRLDNDNPQYGPGLVAWRDKHAQNSNKSNNVYLAHEDGRRHTVAQWARMTHQSSAVLYKRRQMGWSDMEIITGDRLRVVDPLEGTPWPYLGRLEWEQKYHKAISKNPGMSRMEFLCRAAKAECQRLQERCMEISEQQDPYDGEPDDTAESRDLLKRIKDLLRVQKEANQQLEYEARLNSFVHRTGGDDPARERAIFALLHPRPVFTVNSPPSDN